MKDFLIPDADESFSAESSYTYGFPGETACVQGVDFYKPYCLGFSRKQNDFPRMRLPVRVKSMSSMESCLIAQMQSEMAEMKKYVNQCFEKADSLRGVFSIATTMNGSRIDQGDLPSTSGVNGSNLNSSQGAILSSDRVDLLSLGISIGLIGSILANKGDDIKINRSFKQDENPIQDSQQELEVENTTSVVQVLEGPGFSKEEALNQQCRSVHGVPFENVLEDMSKLEAELQAEFEKLGINMESNSSDVTMDEEDGVSGWNTPYNLSIAVSPKELCLRLHEVIQERLEVRVRELEDALQNSQRDVHKLESILKSHCNNHSIDYSSSSII